MSEEQLIREALAEANKEFNLGAILSNKDRARLIAQGAALGYGDEIEALIRSMSPDVTYDEAVDEIRKSIDVAKLCHNCIKPPNDFYWPPQKVTQ